MNAGWLSAIIAGTVAFSGWAWFMARMVWTVRGILDAIRDDQHKLEQHLAWHWQKGDSHALFDESRRRQRKPRQQAHSESVDRPD